MKNGNSEPEAFHFIMLERNMTNLTPKTSSYLTPVSVSSVSHFTSYRSIQQRVQKKMHYFMAFLSDPML